MQNNTTRRDFLRAAATCGGAAAGAGLLPGLTSLASATASPFGPAIKTKHLVLIAFAGGVRTRETFGSPDNVPTLSAMADEGVLYPRVRTSNLGHFGATLSMFTGISEARGIRENARGPDPTVFEYLRKDLGLPASEVWVTTAGGAQQVNYAYGMHADYGPRFGATTLDGDGIFNREFRDLITQYGKPADLPAGEQELLQRMRDGLEGSSGGRAEAAARRRVEEYILGELGRGTSDLTGANSGDAKALRLARNLLSVFKPSVIGVVLQNADTAHGSYNAYAEVIRRNDAAIGEIWEAVKADADLAESTAIIVQPEFGRDHDLNARRGLDHGDGSDDLNYVSCMAWGPDFRRGKVVRDEVRTIDVVPSVCQLFGAKPKYARGRTLPGLFG